MYTYQEILNQAEQLQKTYVEVEKQTFQDQQSDVYLFIGCGTSFYLASSAARYFQTVTGKVAQALPASEIFIHPESSILEKPNYHVIAISRSGTTSEVIEALKFLQKRANVKTLSVTCHGDSPMAKLSDQTISLDHINEKSVVMTQSFSNMLYALQIYAAKLVSSVKDLHELAEVPNLTSELLKDWENTKAITDNHSYKRYIFLGSGIYNGIAKEATLKLKEMTQTECESYSNLEFRHGPISVVDKSTVVVLMSQSNSDTFDQELVNDIQRLNGSVLAIGPFSEQFSANHIIQLDPSLSDRNRLVLYVPHLQLLAYHKALSLGYNPDQPRNLTQVVTLNL
ncbi:SIS domain-containing protein [Rossellomorea sp. BNER]|uniref:SIS domain-containing protein n=1 Tax=Rossellomorea sp. BNER TaxID=2962031 RepID=UPI003AF3093C|nr:SIS domain-containing protein [Rossellomorea sp. BNER]